MVASGAEIQPDKNWTKVHNSILELLATSSFTARELRCLLFLLRMTYGYQCKESSISLTEWEQGTKLKRGHVSATLKELVARNVITKAETGKRTAPVWSFNKYFEQWQDSTPLGTTFSGPPLGTICSTPLGTLGSTPVQCATTPYKEKKETVKESEPASDPSVEQTEKVQPTAPISNDYFGMRRPVRRERVIADGYTQDAKKFGVDAESYVAIFNALIDIAGWQDLVTLGDDTKLNFAKRDALLLIGMGHKSPDDIRLLADAYMKANAHWRNTPPQPKDLAEYASQLKAGVLREGKKESRPGANREIHSVKFAKPGDDIYA